MTYFPDLTPHSYSAYTVEDGVLNVGWLGEGNSFLTGDVPGKFVSALKTLCSCPILLHRGMHNCEYCGKESGNGQIRVCHSNRIWYAAPTMVYHYVVSHRYLPPVEFIEAVLHPLLVSDRLIENDYRTWQEDIRSFFPDWQSASAAHGWPTVKQTLTIGQSVTGRVIARAPLVIWADIGVGFPAFLRIPDEELAVQGRIGFIDFRPKGTTVYAEIDTLGPDGEIGLTFRR